MNEIFPNRPNIKKYASSIINARMEEAVHDLRRIFPSKECEMDNKDELDKLKDKMADLISSHLQKNLFL